MQRTKIDYLTHTWNPVTGCSPVSAGCAHCWAARTSKRHGWPWGKATLHHDRLGEPLRLRKPAVIGVAFMGDLFHESVPENFIADVWAVMALASKHRFLVLTKRPARMRSILQGWVRFAVVILVGPQVDGMKFTDGRFAVSLPNVWLGVSVEDQPTADERVKLLLQTPAAHRWVSVEPMLGGVDMSGPVLGALSCDYHATLDGLPHPGYFKRTIGSRIPGVDWVVCGGESGPGARPMHPDWPRSLRDQCKAACVPFYFKQAMEGGKLNHLPTIDGKPCRETPWEVE